MVRVNVCMCVRVVHVRACACVRACARSRMHLRASMRVRGVRVCMCACACVYAYAYSCVCSCRVVWKNNYVLLNVHAAFAPGLNQCVRFNNRTCIYHKLEAALLDPISHIAYTCTLVCLLIFNYSYIIDGMSFSLWLQHPVCSLQHSLRQLPSLSVSPVIPIGQL